MIMKRHILFFLFLGCMACTEEVLAQTLSQAKAMYEKGEYKQAKPVFQRFVKSQPANGNYNLWYGVCCLMTGQSEESVSYLETAVRKRIPSGQFYLGKAYHAVYRFDDAIQVLEEYIAELQRRKRPSEEAEKLLEKSKMGARLLKGVEEVCFVDSIVVDKATFLEAYNISPESGRLFMYDTYFKDKAEGGSIVYQTEMGDKIYYARQQPSDGKLHILTSNRTENQWSEGSPLPGIDNEGINENYPYVMTDGITLYYASEGEGSLGGYDIFVTRYNTANDSYLYPENVGMPFNSPYNDYMYVVDEYANLGWFATDRYQEADKVCVYVFIPNSSKQVYDYERTPAEQMRSLAQLRAIRDTWIDQNAVDDARQRLAEVRAPKTVDQQKYDFTFIIDDRTVYHHIEEFRSPQAKISFQNYRKTEKNYKQAENKLDNLRLRYQRANGQDKAKMATAILDLEKRCLQQSDELRKLTILIRQQEKDILE